MRKINITRADMYKDENDIKLSIPVFTRKDYEERISLLLKKMEEAGLTHTIVYADREHSANMEYLTGYDPRFEESLLIISGEGDMTLLVGNEGWAYSFISPIDVKRVMYQNFSLQGQPRDKLKELEEIFSVCGIDNSSLVGIIGFKYFEEGHISDGIHKVDIPSYIVDELCKLVERERIINFTQSMTHPAEGIRMVVRSPKEIAFYEYACSKVSNCIMNILKGLEPGISELEASGRAGYDASPVSMFPIVNFGEENVRLGLRSPGMRKLEEGDLVTVCYGIRGSLVARSGLAASCEKNLPAVFGDVMEEFYKPYFNAVALWYESLKIGVNCGEIYEKVMSIIGCKEKFGVTLNPGHNTGSDEWVNSPFFRNSPYSLKNGYYLQSDIIASAGNPLRQAIIEDGIILADEGMRDCLKEQYPQVYERIQRRRRFVREVIGINLDEDVLPLSNTQAVFHPYFLDTGKIFTMD